MPRTMEMMVNFRQVEVAPVIVWFAGTKEWMPDPPSCSAQQLAKPKMVAPSESEQRPRQHALNL